MVAEFSEFSSAGGIGTTSCCSTVNSFSLRADSEGPLSVAPSLKSAAFSVNASLAANKFKKNYAKLSVNEICHTSHSKQEPHNRGILGCQLAGQFLMLQQKYIQAYRPKASSRVPSPLRDKPKRMSVWEDKIVPHFKNSSRS